MWTILKFENKSIETLKKEFSKVLGKDYIIYIPKLFIQKYKNNKLIEKEFNLLGDYLFCFHKKLSDKKTINALQYSKGLKCILNGFSQSQVEIKDFIKRCKESETKNGYLTQDFFEINVNSECQFITGPFSNTIFKIIEMQKNKIKILMGDLRTTINKKEFLFKPV
jgi:hypothetical protein